MRRLGALLSLGAIAAAACVGGGESGESRPPLAMVAEQTPAITHGGAERPVEGTLAFDRDGEIYVVEVGGSEPVNLTNHPASDIAPVWSPDGSRIAFISTRDGPSSPFSLYVMDSDGSNPTRVAHPITPFEPSWSPDGQLLAFVSRGGLSVATLDPLHLRSLTIGTIFPLRIAWSPDGDKIAVVAFPSADGLASFGNSELYAVSLDGGITRLTESHAFENRFAWAPDSSRIAIERGELDAAGELVAEEIYIVSVDVPLGETRLIEHSGADPFWLPDGERIAYTRQGGDEPGIWAVDSDGSNPRRLLGPLESIEWIVGPLFRMRPGGFTRAYWSPDGSRVAYVRTGRGSELYVADADGSTHIRVMGGLTSETALAWKPAPSAVLASPVSLPTVDPPPAAPGPGDLAADTTFQVDSTVDAVDAATGDGVCRDDAGRCTLRAAVMEANATEGAVRINLPPGTYSLALAGMSEEAALTGDLDLTDDVIIQGAGAEATILDGAGLDRLFDIVSPETSRGPAVVISSLTIRGGDSGTGSGGGVQNRYGALTMTGVVVSGNVARRGPGGGISSLGSETKLRSSTLLLVDSTVTGNVSGNSGGGVFCSVEAALELRSTAVSDNEAQLSGGGVFSGSALSVVNSSIHGNTAKDGGGIYSLGDGHVTETVVAGNTATGIGGGIKAGATLSVSGVTITDNTSAAGGGLYNSAFGTADVAGSTINDNVAAIGGGILSHGTLIITSSTVSGNTATITPDTPPPAPARALGGGIYNGGQLALTDVSITDNSADSDGGGIFNGDTLTLTDTTISGNTATECRQCE